MSGLAVASWITEGQNALVESLSRGERLRLRRERAGLTQPQMAVAAGIGVETVVNIEKDRNVQTLKLAAYEDALAAHEQRASLQVVTRPGPAPYPSPLTGPVHPPSTNDREGGADDPATARTRELADRLDAAERKITALQHVLDTLVRTTAERDRAGKASANQARRGKGNR